MGRQRSRRSKIPPELAAKLLERCQTTIDGGDDEADDAAWIMWRYEVERCAFTKADKILRSVLKDGCDSATAEELASALWLMQWLGESDWDGTGRTSGGI